uniref:Secreted protein n=1 Tax=Anguilla anguilla TaxID=7936 RepID=A0A0E9WW25_ANGAN
MLFSLVCLSLDAMASACFNNIGNIIFSWRRDVGSHTLIKAQSSYFKTHPFLQSRRCKLLFSIYR